MRAKKIEVAKTRGTRRNVASIRVRTLCARICVRKRTIFDVRFTTLSGAQTRIKSLLCVASLYGQQYSANLAARTRKAQKTNRKEEETVY